MTSQEIYKLAIKLGTDSDLRGQEGVKKYLQRTQRKFEKLTEEEKKYFDQETLDNPYSDSRLLVDNNLEDIKKVMIGIDIGGAELLLADKEKADLVISHHPHGKALADLHSVMDLQSQVLASYGLPINIAESVIKPRIQEISRKLSPENHNRAVDMAKILKLDFMCSHTPCDNLATNFIINLIEDKKPEFVEDLLNLLQEVPEYQEASKLKAGPKLFAGSKENSCGKIAVTEFTGGTEGSKDIYKKMAQYGIGTVVGMHMSEEHRKEAEKHHINVIIAGHMSSDSLGVNLFADKLEKQGIEIIPVAGFIRIKRN